MDSMARSSQRSGFSVRGLSMDSSEFIVIIIGGYADVFDGLMIVLAMFTLNIFHPGTYLRDDYTAVPPYNEP